MPEVWDSGQHLLEWFWDIDSLVGANGFGGMNPVDPVRVQSWSSLTGNEITPWEGRTLLEMARARQAGPLEAIDRDEVPTHGINAAVFDAVFG